MKKSIVLLVSILFFASMQAQTTKTYKVGDYYNDGLKEGVVFQVSADGTKGKIVSMNGSGMLMWSSSSNENMNAPLIVTKVVFSSPMLLCQKNNL